MATAKKSREKGKAKRQPKQSAESSRTPLRTPPVDENQRYGVFAECDDNDLIPPVLMRQCRNRFEAFGWREFWKVDDYITVSMTICPIDKHGNPIEPQAACDAVEVS